MPKTRKYHEELFRELHAQLERELVDDPESLKIGELHWSNKRMLERLKQCPNGPAKVAEARAYVNYVLSAS